MAYTIVNLLAFNYAGFACVAIIVFLLLTQPFYLSQVLDLDKSRIGNLIGSLGFTDEVVAMIVSPLLGALCDYVKRLTFPTSGHKLLQTASFIVIAISLFGYAKATHISELFILRGLFAIGVSACMSMIPVCLTDASRVPISFVRGNINNVVSPSESMFLELDPLVAHDPVASLVAQESESRLVARKPEPSDPLVAHASELSSVARPANGKISALVGVSTGLGAIFAVSVFLPLPVRLSEKYDIVMREALQFSYSIIACFSILSAVVLALFAYNSKLFQTGSIPQKIPYWAEFREGLAAASTDSYVQLALVGSFVARSTTVCTSVFIPLLVYKYYESQGKCTDGYGKDDCYDGYVFAAILTGVTQTVALICAPLWGWLIDLKCVGKVRTALLAAVLGVIGNYCLCLAAIDNLAYNPKSVLCFVAVCVMGLSQIGSIITSMSLLSLAKSERNIGSLSGLYTFAGGFGILLLLKLGGWWSDKWVAGPFFVLGSFNLVMVVLAAAKEK